MLSRVAAARRAAEAPVIDGKLDDACWRKADVLGQFFKFTTVEPSKYATEARLAYDAKYLYVGLRCFDPDRDCKEEVFWRTRKSAGGPVKRTVNFEVLRDIFLSRARVSGAPLVSHRYCHMS